MRFQYRSAAGREAAVPGENLMRPLIAAVRATCTLGEIADVYRDVFQQYRDPPGRDDGGASAAS